MKTYEELVNQFIDYAIKSKEKVDYLDKKSIKAHNDSIAGYRKVASEINKNYNDKLDEFAKLLNEDNNINISCAVCIIELFDNNQDYIELCKDTIKKYMATTDNKMDALGFELYLKDLERNYK